jgi:hypothetical protein
MPTDSGYYEVSAWGAPVGEGASGARYCTLDGVVKVAESPGDYVVADEFIWGDWAFPRCQHTGQCV